jgi:hypothetical protein
MREYRYEYASNSDPNTKLLLITSSDGDVTINDYPPKIEGYSFTGVLDIIMRSQLNSAVVNAVGAHNHLDSVCYDSGCRLHGSSLDWHWDITNDFWIYELPNKAITPGLPKRPSHSLQSTCNDERCVIHQASAYHTWNISANQWTVPRYVLSDYPSAD